MKKRDYIVLYIVSIGLYFALLIIQHAPAYFDAEYYYAQGIQIATGSGFHEPYLWNYLNAPAQLPNAAFLYWMPLTSLVASIGMILSGTTNYIAAVVPLILLAGLVPVLAAYLATKLSALKFAGWYAGALALLGGYFLPYVTQIDSYYLYMLGGGIFFVFLSKMWAKEKTWMKSLVGFIALGGLAGLMHLARADGILWVAAALGVVWIPYIFRKAEFSGQVLRVKNGLLRSAGIIGGYLALTGAWYVRNIQLFGTLMPPDNTRNLYLTEYNDIFSFPSSMITLQRWLASGFSNIVSARLESLLINVATLIGVSGGVILITFMVVGFIHHRKSPAILYLAFLILFGVAVMSFVFPFAGQRGGFFHSVSAFQPILWALTPVGIDVAIGLGVKKRKWQSGRSWIMFGGTIMAVFILITGYVFGSKVINARNKDVLWDGGLRNYQAVDQKLVSLTGNPDGVVMVVDPPGYFLASGRSAIVTPQGDLDQVLQAARQYDAKYLILEEQQLTSGMKVLYYSDNPVPGFTLIETKGEMKIYELEPSIE